MAISWDDFDKIWASTSPLTPYSFSDNNYKQGWNFVGATPPARQMWDAIQKANDEKFKFLRDNFGTPNIVTTASQMTDTSKVYVYMGSEAGWSNGHWYYYNGTAWADGGVYNAVAVVTDTTLTKAGVPADAKATGDALSLKADASTVPVVDSTLTISGAAADAQVTGDAIANTQTEMSLFGADDLLWEFETGNSSTYNGIKFVADRGTKSVSVNGTATGFSFFRLYNNTSGLPSGITAGETYIAELDTDMDCNLQIYPYINGNLGSVLASTKKQQMFTVPSNATGLMVRLSVSKDVTVSGVVRPLISKVFSLRGLCDGAGLVNWGLLANNSDADNYTTTGFYTLESSSTYSNVPLPSKTSYGLLTIYSLTRDQVVQTVEYILTQERFYRTCSSGVWSEWKPSAQSSVLPANTDLDNLEFAGTWLLSSGYNYANAPITNSQSGLLRSYRQEGSTGYVVMQIVYGYGSVRNIYRRNIVKGGSWSEWVSIGGGEGDTYNTTQNITQVSNSNTYNSTISPSITTDNNGWLQPVDTESEDETGKTDMTPAIMAMLNSTGYCHLAPGIFYVSGNIDMPEGSTLEGCGKNTIIRLLSSVSAGYCVRMGRYNTIKNITFSGGYNAFEPTTADIGGRNGVIFIANKDGTETTQPTVRPCMLTQCWFHNFNGSAIYAHNSGGGLTEAMIVSDCHIYYCEAGINLDYYTEYHKFTNMIVSHCYYACINNGGNNVFTGCTFHGTIGFLIDNSSGTKRNNAHGSVVGCTFNHIDNWNNPSVLGMGDAIKIIGSSTPGFIFTGCQIWYGAIVVNNAIGIAFSDCLIGGNTPKITIENNATAFFSNCMFLQRPNIINTALAKFDNCYLTSDGSVITGV